MRELSDISGVGDRKLEAYGEQILALVRERGHDRARLSAFQPRRCQTIDARYPPVVARSTTSVALVAAIEGECRSGRVGRRQAWSSWIRPSAPDDNEASELGPRDGGDRRLAQMAAGEASRSETVVAARPNAAPRLVQQSRRTPVRVGGMVLIPPAPIDDGGARVGPETGGR